MARCWQLVAALCVMAAVSASALSSEAEMEDSDLAMEEIDLTLPAFPPAPKRDRGLLHEDQEDSDEWQPESDRAFRASSYPRFRTDRGYMTDYVAEDAGEATLEFGGDESQTVSVTPQEEDSDAGNDVADLPASPYFGQPAYIEQGARLRRARGGSLTDPSMLPPVPQTLNPYDPEPLPPPPAGMATAAAYAAAAQNARQNSNRMSSSHPSPPRRENTDRNRWNRWAPTPPRTRTPTLGSRTSRTPIPCSRRPSHGPRRCPLPARSERSCTTPTATPWPVSASVRTCSRANTKPIRRTTGPERSNRRHSTTSRRTSSSNCS